MESTSIDRVYIFGASGSGTSTLGAALAERLALPHLDTDDFFWLPTEPKFFKMRPTEEFIALLNEAFDAHPRFVISGSMSNFGSVFFPRFTLAIWVTLPHVVRMERLEIRQRLRYGDALDNDPEIIQQNTAFLDWARQYDEGGLNMRSYAVHQQIFENFQCATLRLDGVMSTEEQVARVLAL